MSSCRLSGSYTAALPVTEHTPRPKCTLDAVLGPHDIAGDHVVGTSQCSQLREGLGRFEDPTAQAAGSHALREAECSQFVVLVAVLLLGPDHGEVVHGVATGSRRATALRAFLETQMPTAGGTKRTYSTSAWPLVSATSVLRRFPLASTTVKVQALRVSIESDKPIHGCLPVFHGSCGTVGCQL